MKHDFLSRRLKFFAGIAVAILSAEFALAQAPTSSNPPVTADLSNNWLPALRNGHAPNLPANTTLGGSPIIGLSDGDKGDITVSGSGATWTIDAKTISLAKMADMATASFLGRNTAGTSSPEVLSISTVKTMLGISGVDFSTLTASQSVRRNSGNSAYEAFQAADVGIANLFTTNQNIWMSVAANTASAGLLLYNTQSATAANQRYSPTVRWAGNGWKTDSTATSQQVDFQAYVVPVQGTSNPTGYWILESRVNGASFGNVLTYSTSGVLSANGSGLTNLNIATANVTGRIGSANLPLGAQLYDNAGTPTLAADFGTRKLKSSAGFEIIDWEAGFILAADGSDSFQFNNRILLSDVDVPSLNYLSRQLIANDGSTVVMDWSDPTNVNFFGTAFITAAGAVSFVGDAAGVDSDGKFYGNGSNLTGVTPAVGSIGSVIAGTKTATGTATTTFTVTIGVTMANTTYKVTTEGDNALSAAVHYVNNKTTTTFDIVYLAGLTGSVAVDWIVSP